MDTFLYNNTMPPLVANLTNLTTCAIWSADHKASYERFYIIDISSMILCFINVLTNLAAYLIFYHDKQVGTFNRLLMNLSLCECSFQIFYFIYTAVENYLLLQGRLIFSSYNGAVIFSIAYLYVLIPMLTTSHIARNWAVILISLYRFETLVRAFSTKWLIFVKGRDLKICFLINFISLLISVPRYAERNVFICISQENSIYTIMGFGGRALMSEAYKYIYQVTTLFIFQNGGPTILVCSIGALITIKLADRKKVKDRLLGKHEKETIPIVAKSKEDNTICDEKKRSNVKHFIFFRKKQLSQSRGIVNRKSSTGSRGGRLVFVLSVLFVVCELPSFFNKLFGIIGVFQDSTFNLYLIISSNLATLLDSFVNFFIYLLSNQRFRQNVLDRVHVVMKKCHFKRPWALVPISSPTNMSTVRPQKNAMSEL